MTANSLEQKEEALACLSGTANASGTPNTFDVAAFESLVYRREYEEAGKMLIQLLSLLDGNYGNIPPNFTGTGYSTFSSNKALCEHVFTRLTSAICALLGDPGFQLSEAGYLQILPLQRWLNLLLAYTPFRNMDHVIRSLNNLGWNSEAIQWRGEDLFKMAFMTVPDSQIPLDLDSVWEASPVLALGLCMVWLSPRFLGTEAAHFKREVVLGWMPEKLSQVPLEQLPINILHDVYMHCSYASRTDRHRIKRVIHESCHAMLLRHNVTDLPCEGLDKAKRVNGKPVMLVLLEWFNPSHSVYRTHFTSLNAAKEKFYIIGMGYGHCIDERGRAVFDEFISVRDGGIVEQVQHVREVAQEHCPSVMYMPAVGMFLLTIFTASMRFAPLQLAAIGHGASTQSPWVDYFAIDEDFMGDRSTYTEDVIALPKDAMPFVRSALLNRDELKLQIREAPEVVKIGVAATTMKINPGFLRACAQVVEKAKTKVHFHFMVGQGTDLIHPLVRRFVEDYLGEHVTVTEHLNYLQYMQNLADCDMFITPFPYGNMNGIADAVTLGLVGVCKSGPEVHEHIDVGLFQRLGLPDWTITETVESYIEAVVRMVDGHKERVALRKELMHGHAVDVLYKGRPEILSERLIQLLEAKK